jgi:PKD repeat protein
VHRHYAFFVCFAALASGVFANQAPSLTLPASATPNPVQAGQSVTLSVTAEDPDGDTLTYTWTFGDGTPDALGATVTHVYAAPGIYEALILVQDGHGNQANDFVGVAVIAEAAALDIDFSKFAGKLTPTQTGKDSLTIKGKILGVPAGANPAGRAVTVNLAGLSATINLKGTSGTGKPLAPTQTKGRAAPSPIASVSLKFTVPRNFAGGDLPFQITYKNATFITPFIEYGYDPFFDAAQQIVLPFIIAISDAPTLKTPAGVAPKSASAYKQAQPIISGAKGKQKTVNFTDTTAWK